MKLQYLGTAAAEGWPGIFCQCAYCETVRKLGGRNLRTRSQAVVYADKSENNVNSVNKINNANNANGVNNMNNMDNMNNELLLIDLPPDTYAHCLMHGLRMDAVTHLLITHSHHDHFAVEELQYRMEWFADCENRPLHIYGNEAVRDKLAATLANAGLTFEQVHIHYHIAEYFTPFTAGAFTVTPLKANHARTERCLIYAIENGGKRLLYAHDTGRFPEETWDYLQNRRFDLVSLDCTSGSKQDGGGHMGLPDTAEVKKRLAASGCIDEASRVVLNHFSHNGTMHYDAMVPAAQEFGMDVSYDGYIVEA